jgi:hypothetical protein
MIGTALRFGAALFVLFGSLAGTGDLLLGNPGRGSILLVGSALMLAWILGRKIKPEPQPIDS